MDSCTFNKWLQDPCAIIPLQNENQRIIYCDNAKGRGINNDTIDSFAAINSLLQKLLTSATHLFQPLESFFIRKINSL